jgi:hypothetical protein
MLPMTEANPALTEGGTLELTRDSQFLQVPK